MRPGTSAAPPSTTSDAELPAPEAGVGLLLLDATRCAGAAVDIEDVARCLAPGGVLAVLTTSDRKAGRLLDPRPALIASAQAAGLDYWQHIVTTSPTSGQLRHPHGDVPQRREWCLVADVTVFRRPPVVADRVEQPGPDGTPATTTDGVQR